MNEYSISVIIPVYNVEPYVGRCVQSVMNQSYRNLDIILVDDGSTDGSGELCDYLAAEDERIRVIHQKNKGLAGARNTGLDAAAGDLIFFLDSDDRIDTECLQKMTAAMERSGADLVLCGSRAVRERRGDRKNQDVPGTEDTESASREPGNHSRRFAQKGPRGRNEMNAPVLLDGTVLRKRLLYQQGISTSAWGKLFQREIFDGGSGIRFEEGTLFEDVVPIYEACSQARRAVWLQEPLYGYSVRGGSITKSRFTLRQMDYVNNCRRLLDYVRETSPEMEDGAVNRLVWSELYVIAHSQKGDLPGDMEEKLWNHICRCRGAMLRDRETVKKVRMVLLLSFAGRQAVRGVYRMQQR